MKVYYVRVKETGDICRLVGHTYAEALYEFGWEDSQVDFMLEDIMP